MAAKDVVARRLYNAVSKGYISFNEALRLYKVLDLYFSRTKSPAGKFFGREIIKYLARATSPEMKNAWTSVLFPAEILHAFRIYPITLEVISGTFSSLGLSPIFLNKAETLDVPPTMCSFHRMLMGVSKSGILGTPDVVGATSTLCDGNVKTFAEVAKEQRVPFIFIDVPYEESKEGVLYVKEQLESALHTLAQLAKVKNYQDNLRGVLESANRSFSLFRRFYDLQRVSRKNIFRAHEIANFAFPNHFLLGRKELVKMLEKRCDALKSKGKHNRFFASPFVSEKARRLMWLHIVPQYDTPIWKIIDNGEETRVVCDEYSTVLYEDYDLSDPLGSIAKRLINHPSNGPIEKRVAHILKVARDFRVDGIVHYSSWGCHQAAGNVYILERELEAAGYRFLNLNGDAADRRNSSPEQHRTRIEAFLENYGRA